MILKIFRVLSPFTNNSSKILCHKNIRSFCKLPKPSRFSEQLGLHKQFESTKVAAEKDQRSNVKTSYFIIWGCLCVIGSFIAMTIVKQQLRDALILRYKQILLGILPQDNKSYYKILQQIIRHEDLHLSNRVFSSSSLIDMLDKCISNYHNTNNHEQLQKFHQLADVALKNNLNNQSNSLNENLVYKKYFQKLLGSNFYNQSSSMNIIISFLLKHGDLQLLYLISLLCSKSILTLNKQQKLKINQRLVQQKQQIKQISLRLAQIRKQNPKIMIDPYQFQYQIKRKWVKFIQRHIFLQ